LTCAEMKSPRNAAQSEGDADTKHIWIVYDGMCPFCTSYVMRYRIGQLADEIHMIDARSGHPLVQEVKAGGLDLEDGMAVKWNGRCYHGADALHLLAILGSARGLFNRLNRQVLSRPKLAHFLYPHLVTGRRLTLKMLGRPPIDA
jgi:predicted DCC family thiol-disulfide oxidoreductase YuxK